MTPGARVAAAIEILDHIAAGQAAEAALTRWARSRRFAGSGDRAAIRDHVYDALRHWRSDACRGGGITGRARMIGRFRETGQDAAALFNGVGHAPAPVSDKERAAGFEPSSQGDQWDLPDWLIAPFEASLAAQAGVTARALTQRAPVTVRVNVSKADRSAVQSALYTEGIQTVTNPRAGTALTITAGHRRLRQTPAFAEGLVELQDASSQAAVAGIEGTGAALDFCAGGGGKALALAAAGWNVTAYDADPKRMRDLPPRADRGGHDIAVWTPQDIDQAGEFDLVLCDAPCSGSGTWRRTPEAKWTLTPERLHALKALQAQVLVAATPHVKPGGRLVYATCSVLESENQQQVDALLRRDASFTQTHRQNWPVDEWGDGFFVAHLLRGDA